MSAGLSKRFDGYLFAAPFLLLFAGFVVSPLVYGFVLSFMRWDMTARLPAEFAAFTNYTEAFGDPYFRSALKVTFLFVLFVVPLTVLCGLGAALGLAAITKRRGLYRAAFLLPTMLNVSVAAILWKWFYNSEFGLINHYTYEWFGYRVPWLVQSNMALASIVIMTVWWTIGNPSIILMAGIQQIPSALYEAAAVDGAGPWQRFLNITLPGIRPVLLFVTIMSIIGSFQVFGQTFILTEGGPQNSTRGAVHYIYQVAFNFYRMGYAAAMSWILFIFIAAFSLLQLRLMREK